MSSLFPTNRDSVLTQMEEGIEALRRQLVSKAKTVEVSEKPPRKKRSDCTLQEWTEYQRSLERGYDAKRRAKKRAEGATMTIEERRTARTAQERRANPPSSHHALDTVVMAMQALEKAADLREEPATGALAELENHLKERVRSLRASIQS